MHPQTRSDFAFAEEGSTADQILLAAGRLFASKGFHGTSTREIAAKVGIRQPSLFHHFASKAAIAAWLFEYDRRRSPMLGGEIELAHCAPAVCIYQVLRSEAKVVLTSRYELQGLYLTEIIQEPDFHFWRDNYATAVARVEERIVAGINSGDFLAEDPNLVVELFDAMQTRMVRWSQGQSTKVDPDRVASLLLRAILARPEELAEIRVQADDAANKAA